MERLKHDVEQVHNVMSETQQSARLAQHMADQLQAANHAASDFIRETADKVHTVQLLFEKVGGYGGGGGRGGARVGRGGCA